MRLHSLWGASLRREDLSSPLAPLRGELIGRHAQLGGDGAVERLLEGDCAAVLGAERECQVFFVPLDKPVGRRIERPGAILAAVTSQEDAGILVRHISAVGVLIALLSNGRAAPL